MKIDEIGVIHPIIDKNIGICLLSAMYVVLRCKCKDMLAPR